MKRDLHVYLNESLTGHLTQDNNGRLSFAYATHWLNNPDAVPLSCSLPLRQARYNARECRSFFAGILPEESSREIIARILGISARNDYAMLEQIGGECAGAISFI